MNIIDCHLHLSDISAFTQHATINHIDYSPQGYAKECKDNHVLGIAMGVAESPGKQMPDKEVDPLMGIQFEKYPNAYYSMGINPHRFDERAALQLEERIQNDPHLVGIKIYGGYYHYFLSDPVYSPAFELAEKYHLPITFHSGDTFSSEALLKYAHPLIGDDVAKMYPNVKIILAHMGNPWLFDAAEVAYRNPNIYVDISGLYVGKNLQKVKNDRQIIEFHQLAIKLIHNFEKVLYGSDWPLSPMADYIDFVKELIPEEYWQKVFYQNAVNVFQRLEIKNQ